MPGTNLGSSAAVSKKKKIFKKGPGKKETERDREKRIKDGIIRKRDKI